VLRNQIERDIIAKEEDKAFWAALIVALCFFLLSLGGLHYAKTIFGPEQEVSTMGTSAAVMILSNILSWPSILEGIRAQPALVKQRSHLKRAQDFLGQLDEIVEFCSQLMNQIKDLAGEADDANAPKVEEAKEDPHK